MNTNHLAKSIAALLLASTSILSQASIVSQSVTAANGQSFNAVYDPVTSLQWLSPTATQRLTIGAVLGDSGGWISAGYRYATSEELTALLGDAGVSVNIAELGGLGQSWLTQSDISALMDLITAIGWTYENNPPSQGDTFGQRSVYGILDDLFLGDGQSPPSHRYALLSTSSSNGYGYSGGQWLYSNQDSVVGSFLVKNVVAAPVPEPESYALVVLGMGLLLWSRRRCA